MVIVWCFGGSVAAFLLVWVLLQGRGLVQLQGPVKPLSLMRQVRLGALLLLMAFIEEGIFRWLLLGQASRLIGLGPAFILSVAAFTLAHRTNGPLSFSAIVNLLVVSTILGILFWWWGLWAAVAAHFGWNLTQWWLGFTVSGEKTRPLLPAPRVRKISGHPYGPESHWAATVVMMGVLIALLAPGLAALRV